MRNRAQVLLRRSCTLGKLVNTQIKEHTLLCTGKNNICISCVFNGFKYTILYRYDIVFWCMELCQIRFAWMVSKAFKVKQVCGYSSSKICSMNWASLVLNWATLMYMCV